MCRVRKQHTMGVIMQNHTASSARRRLAVLGLLATIGTFSIVAAAPTAAQASSSTDSVSVATSTTPDGVIGWD